MQADLQRAGGALASLGGSAVGCLRFEREPTLLQVRRLAVDPSCQGQGIGTALMQWAHEYARDAGYREVRVGVRPQLEGNIRFYQRLGYRVVAEHRHHGYDRTTWVEMSRAL